MLFSFGISGAIQHTAAIADAGFIVAVNKNPNATMMNMADVAIVADANQVCTALIRALREGIRESAEMQKKRQHPGKGCCLYGGKSKYLILRKVCGLSCNINRCPDQC